MAAVHKAIEDRRAHMVVAKIRPPILHDTSGRDDDAAVQLVALMGSGFAAMRWRRLQWCGRRTNRQARADRRRRYSATRPRAEQRD